MRGTLAALALMLVLAAPTSAAQQYNVSYHAFTLPKDGLTSSWTSPVYVTGFGFSELVASWNAQTPAGTYIRVQMGAVRGDGRQTKWYTMGIWAYGGGNAQRTWVGGPSDASAENGGEN